MTTTTSPAVLAVDLGGTSMKGVVVGGDGREVASRSVPTPDDDVVAALTSLLGELAGLAADHGVTPVGVGVVTPGSVDEARGVVRYASNLRWRDLPLRDLLGEALDLPVAVGHDVRAAGLAEQLFGAGRGSDSFVLVPIGTGVAAAIVNCRGDGRRIHRRRRGVRSHPPRAGRRAVPVRTAWLPRGIRVGRGPDPTVCRGGRSGAQRRGDRRGRRHRPDCRAVSGTRRSPCSPRA